MSKSPRLNDTAAVVAMVPYESSHEHYSRTVRPIENGFIVSEHKTNPNDPEGPTHREVFMRDHPDQKDASEMGGNGGAMRKAVEHLNKR